MYKSNTVRDYFRFKLTLTDPDIKTQHKKTFSSLSFQSCEHGPTISYATIQYWNTAELHFLQKAAWIRAICFNNTQEFPFFLSNVSDRKKQQGLSGKKNGKKQGAEDIIKHKSKIHQNEWVSPLFGLGKLSCRWKTTFSTKCWMLLCSGPRTNTIQSWVKPSTVGFFRTWARWPSSSFTWTAPCETKKQDDGLLLKFRQSLKIEEEEKTNRPLTLHVCDWEWKYCPQPTLSHTE